MDAAPGTAGVDEAGVTAWFARHVPEAVAPLAFTRVAGGRSNPLTLDSLASRLPFHLDESNRINEAYSRYAASGRRKDRLLVDIWTYCYIRRYFLIKFLKNRSFRSAELDQVVERTYRKVRRPLWPLDHPGDGSLPWSGSGGEHD